MPSKVSAPSSGRRAATNSRKRQASTSEPKPVSSSNGKSKKARNGADQADADADAEATPRPTKSPRRSASVARATTPAPTFARSTSLAPGTPSRRGRNQPPAYRVREGLNPLPQPVRPMTLAQLKQGLPVGQPALGAAADRDDDDADVLPATLFVFGNGDMGQHGLGTDLVDEIKRPRKHTTIDGQLSTGDLGPAGLEQIAAGGMHTVAIDSNGRLWSWGINDNAALGRQTTREPEVDSEVYETAPMPVEGLAPDGKGVLPGPKELGGGAKGDVEVFRATRVAAGDSVSVALSDDGQIRVWGSFRSNDGLLGFDGQVGSSKTQFQPVALPSLQTHSFAQIACGDDHVIALTTTGLVYSWGNGQQAQLGRRIIERRKINGLNPEKVGLKDIVTIGTGAYHSFAVDKRGNVYGWGLNSLQQVGIDSEEDIVPTPRQIPSLSPKKVSPNGDGSVRVVAISAGQHHSLFLLSDGRVFGCGRCDGCELGLDADSEPMKEVAAMRDEWRANRTEELKAEMAAWEKRMADKKRGANSGEQMGDAVSSEDLPPAMGPPPDEYIPTPVHIPFGEGEAGDVKVAALSAGARFNLATSTDGRVFSWGFGNQSQLGLGDEESAEVPTEVRSKQFRGYKAVAVGAGGQHSTVLAVRDPDVDVE